MPADSPWHQAQTLKTLAGTANLLRFTLGDAERRIRSHLAVVLAALPNEALAAGTAPEPFRYLDLSPFLPTQVSSLVPAYVRVGDYAGFALLTHDRGLTVRDPESFHLNALERIDGNALTTALIGHLPYPKTPPD